MTLNIINFADVAKREAWSFMDCEESFITMKLICHDYLIIYIHDTPTDTDLIRNLGLATSEIIVNAIEIN